jgi:phospholipase C
MMLRVACLAGTLCLAVAAGSAHAAEPVPALGSSHEPTTPIKHVITVLQENHTYDNYFGTYPKGDGLPANVCVPVKPSDPKGKCIRPFHIGSNKVVPEDPDHSQLTFRLQYNRGRMDGFVHALDVRNQDGRLTMGYRDGSDVGYYWNLADDYVLYDRFFSSAAAGSFLNHIYWVAGSAAGGGDRFPPNGYKNLTTIFDRLDAAGVSWKFYVQNYEPKLTFRTLRQFPGNRASQVVWVPLLSIPRFLDNPRLRSHIVDLDQYYTDLHNGTLPAVSYIAPSGPSEHPPSNIASGQAFVGTMINALIGSSAWSSSAFMLAYDDWGGWYDHVKPPQVDRYGYGFRVPALLVSPYAKRGVVDHNTLDFTSILRFIEDNWTLKPLATRDAHAKSIASGFDFAKPPRPPEFPARTRGGSREFGANRPVIYGLYLGVLLLPIAFLANLLLTRRGRRRKEGPASDEETV